MLQVGLEVELFGGGYNYRDIMNEEGLSLSSFKELDGFKVKLSEEYYSNTIEYNFGITNQPEVLDKQIDYLSSQIKKYRLELDCSGPQFVGTHIHIFDKDIALKDFDTDKLLLGVLGFIVKNKEGLSRKSIQRIVAGHQLWAGYPDSSTHDWKGIIEREYPVYYYGNSNENKKYRPIIYSPARSTTGKPKSLEIRIIPNEFLFNGKLEELLTLIENGKIYDYSLKDYKDFFYEFMSSPIRVARVNLPANPRLLPFAYNNITYPFIGSPSSGEAEGLVRIQSFAIDEEYICNNFEECLEFLKDARTTDVINHFRGIVGSKAPAFQELINRAISRRESTQHMPF